MKNKVINLFKESQVAQNEEVKYSTLLEQFIVPFAPDFKDVKYYDDVFEFAINAWNFGNIKAGVPEKEFKKVLKESAKENINLGLLKRMIDYKTTHFKEFGNYIVDYEVEGALGEHVLTVVTQSQEDFMAHLFETLEAEREENEYEENFIDRSAIILKPLQPFIDWCTNLYPDDLETIKETKTYLVSYEIENLETWLKKKFDKIFQSELETWHDNKKEWPQNRNFKMFKEWFQVDMSKMVYDIERRPILKS
jgi:hypothetical protein